MAASQDFADSAQRTPLSITIDTISKSFGAFVALKEVGLHVNAGEFLTILGPSGSGKTTLLNILAGFMRPDRGKLRFGETDVTLLPVNRRELGMVFQNYALFPHMSVAGNVAFPLKVRRMSRALIDEKVSSALAMVGLEHLADRNVDQLSGGQRQRVALARAVVFSPRIVLMDEPLSALDKNLRERMQIEIRQLHAKIGATTIYITHDQREALTMSDRIAVMNHGEVVQCASPQEIYEHPRNSFVADFIGETTLVPVNRCDGGVRLRDGTVLRTPEPVLGQGPIDLVIRSERIFLPDEGAESCNRLPAKIQDVIYQGDSVLALADIAGGVRIALRRSVRSKAASIIPPAGSQVQLGLDVADTLVVSQ